MVDHRETELIGLALRGSGNAFGELLEPHLEMARSVAYRVLQERCAAEDCVQEAALRAWRRLANLEPGRCFRPWFRGIVVRRCLEAIRSHWWSVIRWPDPTELRPLAEDTVEDDWLEGDELRRALASLPPKRRVAIVLRYCEDLSLEEVAAALGIGVSGVKSHINRGLRQLRKALEEER